VEIVRRLTIENDGQTSYRVYLEDTDGRRVTLDTPEMLKDAVAIARAEEIVSAPEPEAEETVVVGETLADTMATVIAIHEARGDAVEYSDCVEAVETVRPKPVPLPIEEVIR